MLIYAAPQSNKTIADDLKQNRNLKQSESNGLITALTETAQETRSDGVILHTYEYVITGTDGVINIDYDFISSLEGNLKTVGYVPDAEGSRSGVTISTGFDLGARNREDLERLGLDLELINQLEPYLGIKGLMAEAFLQKKPLVISEKDAVVIYSNVKQQSTDTLVRRYNNDSDIPFSEIPPKWQTVIASVEYQYGSARQRTPKFWTQVTQQNWSGALANLEKFNDRYPTRRNSEANYIKEHS